METYKITTVLNPPFVTEKTSGGYEGFMVDLLDRIAEGMNIKYDLRLAKDGRYGAVGADGKWNGMIGELTRKEADIAAGALIPTAKREGVVDFTKPFMSENVRLLVKKEPLPEIGLMSLSDPFSHEVWFCIVLAALAVSILFMLIGRFNPYEWRQVPSDKDPRGARHSFGLRDSLMFVFSSLFLQGYRETPKSLAGRILAVSWFAAVFFVLAAYIGNVGPFLRSRGGIYVPFHDINELSMQNHRQVGVIENGSIFRRMESSKDPVFRKLAMKMKRSFVKTSEEGVEQVRRSHGRFVMLTESLYGKHVASKPPCDVMLYGPGILQSELALAVPQNSTLRDKLNSMILSLKEDGTIQQLKFHWLEIKGSCIETEMDSLPKRDTTGPLATVLRLRHMAVPFFIIVCGAILSVVFMFVECAVKRVRQ